MNGPHDMGGTMSFGPVVAEHLGQSLGLNRRFHAEFPRWQVERIKRP